MDANGFFSKPTIIIARKDCFVQPKGSVYRYVLD